MDEKWDEKNENILKKYQLNCKNIEEMHRERADKCTLVDKCIGYSTVILNVGIAITSRVGLFSDSKTWTFINVIIAGLQLIVTGASETGNYGDQKNRNLMVSADFGRIGRSIDKVIGEAVKSRENVVKVMERITAEYNGLFNYKPYVSKKYRDKYTLIPIIDEEEEDLEIGIQSDAQELTKRQKYELARFGNN